MVKKKRKSLKRLRGSGGAVDGPNIVRSVSPSPNAAERALFDIQRLLEGEQFDSLEQANEFLKRITNAGVLHLEGDLPPLDRAQQKMYDAWQAEGDARVTLAREALEISPECADAYVLLAEESVDTAEEALPLLERAVEAGARALGPKYFEDNTGHFWGLLASRPYMRALATMADCLMRLGDRKRAIACLQELLKLNPEDNQGGRYMLTKMLLLDANDKEAGQILKQREEASAFWAYAYALWVFRTEGESEDALEALIQAFNQNHYVPMYVGGVIELPEETPDHYSPGTQEEAEVCIGHYFEPWLETPGAMEWFLGVVSSILEEFVGEESRRLKRRRPKRKSKSR